MWPITAPLCMAETVSRADGVRRHDERHPRQLGRSAGERFEAEARPAAIAPPMNAPSAIDHVERGGRAHVDDDRRRAVEAQRGKGVDQPVVANRRGLVDADRHRDRRRRSRDQRRANARVAAAQLHERVASHRRHDARQRRSPFDVRRARCRPSRRSSVERHA